MIIRNLRAFMIISLTIEIYNKHKSLPVWLWDKIYFHERHAFNFVTMQLHSIYLQCIYKNLHCKQIVRLHSLTIQCIALHYIAFSLPWIVYLSNSTLLLVSLQCCGVFFASFYELYFFSTFSIYCDFALKWLRSALFEDAKFTFQLLLALGSLAFNICLVFCDPSVGALV